MELLRSETFTVSHGTPSMFTWAPGPGTVVNLVVARLLPGETLTVDVIGRSNLVYGTPATYQIETLTTPAAPSDQTAIQTSPVPMPNNQWAVLTRVLLTGGTGDRDVARFALLL